MNPEKTTIPNQIKLPIGVAMAIVVQGIRIRLGRSIVTLTGVTCGIAFLMSILTGQLVKSGVAAEDATRAEVGRIASFIRGELPKLADKTIGVVGSGGLSEIETRIVESFTRDFGAKAVVFDGAASPTPKRPVANSSKGPAADADILFVMGDGAVPSVDWKSFLDKSLNNVIASTIMGCDADTLGVPKERFSKLARTLTDEEKEKIASDKRKERFRTIWIGVISLLVTVIGISNAMLMSVTERFREIGTMKCLGALSSFVTQMFVLEASILGLVGGIAGAIGGAIFAVVVYAITYGGALVFASLPVLSVLLYGVFSVVAGVVLSIIAALYPARVAAAMVPATALRSSV
jgi:ABC-type antimicrobial peptide transport system permease subunit